MIDHRSLSSRNNAQKSTGPKTEAGKTRSAANAMKHGAYSQKIVLTGENAAPLNALLEDHIRTYRPEGPTEETFVQQMAAVLYRLHRLGPAEATVVDVQIQRMNLAFQSEFSSHTPEGKFALAFAELQTRNEGVTHFSREERRLLRQYERLRTNLLETQARRPPQTPGDTQDHEEPQVQQTNQPVAAETENDETKLSPPVCARVIDPYAALYDSFPPLPERTKAA